MKPVSSTRQILHAACRVETLGDLPERFSPPLDWTDIVDRAWRLGLIAHLHQLVQNHIPDAPADVQQRISALHLRQAADAVSVHEQLRETVAVLHAAGIQVIMLKGAALALGVYRNVAARPMRDLDLLVRPQQLAAADAVLTGQGYRPDEFYRPRDWWVENHHHLIPLVREGRPVPIELHRDLVPPWSGISTDLPALWARAEAASVAGVPSLVLSQGDLLLHLCQHLDRLMAKLGSLRDIAEVIGREKGIDWGWLVSEAIRSRSASRTYCALKLAHSIAGAAVPDASLDSLRRSAGFNSLEDFTLDRIAERALTWTDDGGLETAWLTDCGSALLGGQGALRRLATAGTALFQRVVASGRRRAHLTRTTMTLPASTSTQP